MIIVQLKGGLGNQMFQYAMGRALSKSLQLPLKLDISGYDSNPERDYRLEFFKIHADIAEESEISILKPNKEDFPPHFLHKLRDILSPWHKREVIIEESFNYEEDFRKIVNPCYLSGYWQSEKYFQDFEGVIREDFKLKEKYRTFSKQILQDIKQSNSVSIHVRRGDYANNPKVKSHYGLLTQDYYKKAIAVLGEKQKDITYFVFSDDLQWVRDNFDFRNNFVFVDEGKQGQEYLDLYYMSNCKHHIIANSSFSWWGAWLGKNKDKIVIAPKNWFRTYQEEKTKDLYCDGWIII
jgi:hypothetical protein